MAKRRRNDGLRKLCKCSRKRWSECPHSWYLNYKFADTHYRFSLDRQVGRHIHGKTEALATAEKIRAAIRSGAAPNGTIATPPVSKAVTLDQFTAVYLKRAVNNRSNDVSRFKRLCGYALESGDRFGDQPLKAVTEDDLEIFIDDLRADGLAAHTVNHYIQNIKAAFRWAAEKSYLDKDPISGRSKKLKRQRGNRRTRRLVGDEEHRLIAVPLRPTCNASSSRHWSAEPDTANCWPWSGGTSTLRTRRNHVQSGNHEGQGEPPRARLRSPPGGPGAWCRVDDAAGDPFGPHALRFRERGRREDTAVSKKRGREP